MFYRDVFLLGLPSCSSSVPTLFHLCYGRSFLFSEMNNKYEDFFSNIHALIILYILLTPYADQDTLTIWTTDRNVLFLQLVSANLKSKSNFKLIGF